MRESHLILQESTGNRLDMEAVFRVRNWPDFFPMDSSQLPVLSDRNRPEYCFHKTTGITRNRQFPGRVVRPGLRRQLHK